MIKIEGYGNEGVVNTRKIFIEGTHSSIHVDSHDKNLNSTEENDQSIFFFEK